ncbi:hypothetical protein ACLKMY_00615 [Paraburkholderia mimosarum]|uniref:hypothetical protein n=1 Tax=Paraburkholderia mimosarum TaxID=312026 RepID=UPI0039C1D714
MTTRPLQSVLNELASAVGQRPELAEEVDRFVYGADGSMRKDLFEVTQPGVSDPNEVRASRKLAEFARAVSHGVVPVMPL